MEVDEVPEMELILIQEGQQHSVLVPAWEVEIEEVVAQEVVAEEDVKSDAVDAEEDKS